MDAIKWTFVIVLVLLGVAIALQGLIPSLINISAEIEDSQQDRYRQGIVLENLLSLDAAEGELDYSYQRRRAFIPIQFFQGGGPVEYKKEDGNCYIERVAGLDGQNYGFYVKKTASGPSIDCTSSVNPMDAMDSPVLLVREDASAVPAKVYIYGIE